MAIRPSFFNQISIIAKILIAAIAFLFGVEIYEIASCDSYKDNFLPIILLQILITLAVVVLLAVFRKLEKGLLLQTKAKQEELYKHTIEDISEKLADEEKLLKEYKEAIDKSAIVIKTDTKGIITYVNDKFCELSQYDKSELIGGSYFIFKHADDSRDYFRHIWVNVLAKKTYGGKIRGQCKNGAEFFLEATITPILGVNDEIEEFIAIMFDVTKETIMEKNLFEKVAKEQDEKHKDELSKAKESFLLVFTHELKTPLNAIINFSSFIKKKIEKSELDDKERLVELLTSVKKNGEDMLLSVTNALDTAKLKNNKMLFSSSTFELSGLIEEVESKILPPTDFKCVSNIESGIFVKGDELRIGQIISNIISNALKYGNGEIAVDLKSIDGKFLLCVDDNGFGVKHKEAVFELFWTDEHDMTRISNGTGIGLYFAKMLCDEFGFEITLSDSEKLSGACFCIGGQAIEVKK